MYRVHKNTVRAWIKAGLPTVDGGRPILVLGRDLRDFLEKRRLARKQSCPVGTLYCLKCRAPREPALAMADFIPFTPSTGNLRALCDTCGTAMHRKARTASLACIMPGIPVQIMEAEGRLRECARTSVNCDFEMGAHTYG